tara:strand:- start:1034 stop:1507 length:474 start_codon:yes stop_codon:yes gene_type:complete
MTYVTYEGFEKSGIIEDIITHREWTLDDIVNLHDTVYDISKEIVDNMDIETLFFVTADEQVLPVENPEQTIGQLLHSKARVLVTKMVKQVMNEYMKTAKVKFNDTDNNTNEMDDENIVETLSPMAEDKNEISEGLKEVMNADVKQLTKEEMEKMGMI